NLVTFRVCVTNKGPNTVQPFSVQVTNSPGLVFVDRLDVGGGYDSSNGVWTVAYPFTNPDSVYLTVRYRAITNGLLIFTSEISASSLPDPDSTPNNHLT